MDLAAAKGQVRELLYRQHRADEGSALLNLSLSLSQIQVLLFPCLGLDFAWPPCSQELWQLSGPDVATFAQLPIGCFTLMEIP